MKEKMKRLSKETIQGALLPAASIIALCFFSDVGSYVDSFRLIIFLATILVLSLCFKNQRFSQYLVFTGEQFEQLRNKNISKDAFRVHQKNIIIRHDNLMVELFYFLNLMVFILGAYEFRQVREFVFWVTVVLVIRELAKYSKLLYEKYGKIKIGL